MSTKITPEIIENLFVSQFKVWPQADDNFKALAGVEVKNLDVDGMPVKVQFNPARIVSSAAKVDPEALKKRKCFLCGENRPEVQEGIEWCDKYIILINPFPIFPRHLTIPDKTHTPQLIKGRIGDMVSLAADLKGYTVFYNGPKCGASAPDHMHFQAGNSDFLTIQKAIETIDLMPVIVSNDGEAVLSVSEGLPVNFFVIDTTSADSAEELFDRLYAAMPVPEGETEPMMNILCYVTEEGEARVVIFPRKRHRPSFYGTEGDDCMLLSPASVDMGGVFITPRQVDFEKIDSATIKRIYDELCLDNEEINNIVQSIN